MKYPIRSYVRYAWYRVGHAVYPFNMLASEFRAMRRQHVPWYEYVRTVGMMCECRHDPDAEWVGARGGLTYDPIDGTWS